MSHTFNHAGILVQSTSSFLIVYASLIWQGISCANLRTCTIGIHTFFLEIYKPLVNEPIRSYQIQHLKTSWIFEWHCIGSNENSYQPMHSHHDSRTLYNPMSQGLRSVWCNLWIPIVSIITVTVIKLRISAMYEAKTTKMSNFWTFYHIIQLINQCGLSLCWVLLVQYFTR